MLRIVFAHCQQLQPFNYESHRSRLCDSFTGGVLTVPLQRIQRSGGWCWLSLGASGWMYLPSWLPNFKIAQIWQPACFKDQLSVGEEFSLAHALLAVAQTRGADPSPAMFESLLQGGNIIASTVKSMCQQQSNECGLPGIPEDVFLAVASPLQLESADNPGLESSVNTVSQQEGAMGDPKGGAGGLMRKLLRSVFSIPLVSALT
ncbi:hypothetical protein NDU88_009063 [Pleurodeles waltl]|uniref:Uncharacterized protein n=1 Tax=Pleurodeles waltl TaxID=8319 RepID=A0AAV7QU99_PLEWA|nr:hypothetical protein NDU88_009063 [Pleurodeles waltl]